jgi:RHS repeat-associated protein
MTGLTTSDNSQTAAYIYAYNGDRLQRTLNGTTWNYLYDREDILRLDPWPLTLGPSLYLTQGPGIDDALAESTAAGTNYAYKNMLSSVLQLAGPTGLVASNYNYDAWGQATNWPTPTVDPNPYGYTGREWETAGSYYYCARFYLSALGRLASLDPILPAYRPFTYVGNHPLQYTDPFGLQRMSPSDLAAFVPANNRSGLSDELIICIIYKESSGDPGLKNPKSSARGLMGVTNNVLGDLNQAWRIGLAPGTIVAEDLYSAALNVVIGSSYLRFIMDRDWGGNLRDALAHYGPGYPYADAILECERCMKQTCPDKQEKDCLKPLHGGG